MPWQHWALDEQPLTFSFFKKEQRYTPHKFQGLCSMKMTQNLHYFLVYIFCFPIWANKYFWILKYILCGHFHQATNPEIVKRVSTHTLILSGSKPGGGHFSRYEAKSPWMCSKMRCRDISRSRRCPWVISSNLNEGRKNKNKILLISVVFLHCTTK